MRSRPPGQRSVRMPAESNVPYLPAEGLPLEVGGLMSTRRGGVSRAPFDSLNLRPAGLPTRSPRRAGYITPPPQGVAAPLRGGRPVAPPLLRAPPTARLPNGRPATAAALRRPAVARA